VAEYLAEGDSAALEALSLESGRLLTANVSPVLVIWDEPRDRALIACTPGEHLFQPLAVSVPPRLLEGLEAGRWVAQAPIWIQAEDFIGWVRAALELFGFSLGQVQRRVSRRRRRRGAPLLQ
jgi:hypothetical protein